MVDIICQKCGYKPKTKEETIERGSTCPICNDELKVQSSNSKTCGCIIGIIIIVAIAAALWKFL